jgi:hypothetical protein
MSYLLEIALIINNMMAMMTPTNRMPTHTPALNIPSTTEQPESRIERKEIINAVPKSDLILFTDKILGKK